MSNSIDFATFLRIVPYVVRERKPILIRGRHGLGKSELVYQIARTLRDLPNQEWFEEAPTQVVERRASQMTEGDLIGLPRSDGEVTEFCPPAFIKAACDNGVVLFLDELDRATLEVRQGIFELCDSRKIAGNHLHPDTIIFAAINGGPHGAQYQVGEMDPAELSRWSVFDVDPSVEDWLKWSKDKVDEVVWDFINQNHGSLDHDTDYEPGKVYPCRRSWNRLSDVLAGGDLLKEHNQDIFPLACSFVGMEVAVKFNDFVKSYEWQVTVEDILVDGKINKTKNFGINEHSAMIEKMEAKNIFEEGLAEEAIHNLAEYFVTLPSEVAMKLWTVVGQSPVLANVKQLHQADTSKGPVSSYLVELLTGKSNDDA